jgi:dihydrodipicolinate synthase/N-acetylneuraminate lyase
VRLEKQIHDILQAGVVIPACPLALTANRKPDDRRQRALWRYYNDASAGGIAIAVHTTQFEIRNPKYSLFLPLLEMGKEEMNNLDVGREKPLVRIVGVCGDTAQAEREAEKAAELGYHVALLNLGAVKSSKNEELITHCRRIAEILPLMGFYLQPSVGGRVLGYNFWREFAEIENVVAVKIAPFDRYKTIDVVRAITDSGREDIALYTGNDDNIIMDLLTPYRFLVNDRIIEKRIVGGLLGQWAVWTKTAVEMLNRCHSIVEQKSAVPDELLALNIALTDANAVIFDHAHNFAGCIAGIHEVLRRQGLLEGIWCLDPHEDLSPGQNEEIDRIHIAYPHLRDDVFIQENLTQWLT